MKTLLKRTLPCLAVLAIPLFLLNGCVGYKLGSMLPADIKTVYIPMFVNKTTEPMIEIDATDAAIREIQQDGSLRVVNEEEADAVLEVTLTSYTLSPLAYDKTAKTKADEYRMTLVASVVLKRRATDEVVVENPAVPGESTFLIEGDFTTSKARGLPEAAKDLAHMIIQQVVEAW